VPPDDVYCNRKSRLKLDSPTSVCKDIALRVLDRFRTLAAPLMLSHILSASGDPVVTGLSPTLHRPVRPWFGRMNRIAIVGGGGSGKSTIACQLAATLDLPLTHLDAVYYDPDWNRLPLEEFAARQENLVSRPRWIIEGDHGETLPIRLAAADLIIFLDLPPVTCLWGILQRRWRYGAGQHYDVGVFDRISWSFIRYVWLYRRDHAPRVRALIAKHATHACVIILTNRRQTRRFVAGLDTVTD
jgi:adenylate kinase family enzyme